MIIKRLYKLSQYLEYLYNEREPHKQIGSINAHKADCFDLAVNWMQFLKQEIKEEMFYCRIAKPDPDQYIHDCRVMEVQNKLHLEAQKKVIFEGWEYWGSQKEYADRLNVKFNNAIFPYGDRLGFITPELRNGKITLITRFQIFTLEDLANHTNGQLNINIEI